VARGALQGHSSPESEQEYLAKEKLKNACTEYSDSIKRMKALRTTMNSENERLQRLEQIRSVREAIRDFQLSKGWEPSSQHADSLSIALPSPSSILKGIAIFAFGALLICSMATGEQQFVTEPSSIEGVGGAIVSI